MIWHVLTIGGSVLFPLAMGAWVVTFEYRLRKLERRRGRKRR